MCDWMWLENVCVLSRAETSSCVILWWADSEMNQTLTGSFNKDLCCFDASALHSTVFSFIMQSEELYIITKEQLLLLPISCNANYNDLLLSSYSKHSSLYRFCSNFSPVCFTLLHLESPRSVVQKYNNTHGKRTVVVGRCQRSWWKCETATQNHLCLIQPERQLDRDEPPSVCAVVRQIIVTTSKLWFVWNYEMANVKSINQITAPKGDNNDSLNI